jgi:hypothetical protein
MKGKPIDCQANRNEPDGDKKPRTLVDLKQQAEWMIDDFTRAKGRAPITPEELEEFLKGRS